MTDMSTNAADARPDATAPMADPANRRTVPHDLHRTRFASGYTVASCKDQATAERAVVELSREGFVRDELVLVSEDVDTLRPEPLGDTFEVRNPTSLAKASGLVAGGATGAAVGAAISLAVTFIASGSTASFGPAVLGGGVVGGALGAFFGGWFSGRMRRAPASVYDERFLKSEIMVGVGIAADDPSLNLERATRALRRAGLTPEHLKGDQG